MMDLVLGQFKKLSDFLVIWVPRMSTEDHKNVRMDVSRITLSFYWKSTEGFLDRIDLIRPTQNKTWAHHFHV